MSLHQYESPSAEPDDGFVKKIDPDKLRSPDYIWGYQDGVKDGTQVTIMIILGIVGIWSISSLIIEIFTKTAGG